MNDLLKKNHVKYGLVMSGVVVLCLLLMEVTGQNQSFEKSPITFVLLMLSPFLVWYLGIKARKDAQKGKLTFKEGVNEGFKISVVYGLVSPFIFALYYLLVNPAILEYVRTSYSIPESTSDTVLIVTDMLVQAISAVVFGTIYAAIISFFLKSKTAGKKKK